MQVLLFDLNSKVQLFSRCLSLGADTFENLTTMVGWLVGWLVQKKILLLLHMA